MKNLLSILCVIALLTVSFGATANPDLVDTSQKTMCVDDYSPDVDAFVSFEHCPTFAPDAFVLTKSFAELLDLPVPDSPNIGCTSKDFNNIFNHSSTPFFNRDALYSPNIGFLTNITANTLTLRNSVLTASNAPNSDLTAGFSAECSSNNGTSVPVAKLIKRATYPVAKQ